MYTRLTSTFLTLFSVACLALTLLLPSANAAQPDKGSVFMIKAVQTDMKQDGFVMTVAGDTPPAYTVSERFDPFRVVIDIAGAKFDDSINMDKLLPPNPYSKLHLTVLNDEQPAIGRFEFTVDENLSYDVRTINNDLEIKFVVSESTPPAAEKVAEKDGPTPEDKTIFSAPEASKKLLGRETAQKADADIQALQDSFSFSGYNKERISVDFYKIDLHNVFRLFRQITDLNIIVDEAVNGSITLALSDVPWDFALDIILNLADLKKEERFNTIVIYPKNKEFLWPTRAEDNLSFEADVEVVQEEALIIEQSTNLSAEIMKAKELLVKAKRAEKTEDFEDAVGLYEQAFNLWPENAAISNKIANIYLGHMNQNARALHFAKQSLEKDPSNTRAALYCAISSANMNLIPEALEFFTQSVSGQPPMKEALISYAAFSENNQQPDVALKLLDTYSSYYGDNVHTMVSKARILDKIGEREKATAQYKSLLTSGYQMRPDLKKFVQSRVGAGNF